jgi:hypothetical protein
MSREGRFDLMEARFVSDVTVGKVLRRWWRLDEGKFLFEQSLG